MSDLIAFLPQVIIYIALGYIYLKTFRFICMIESTKEYEPIIWESLFVGYVINLVLSLIPINNLELFHNNEILVTLFKIVLTTILAFLAGRFCASKVFDKLIFKIGIHRTRNKNLFDDMIDDKCATYLDLCNYDTKERYYGIIYLTDEFQQNPHVVLHRYKHWLDYDNENTMEDYTDDNSVAVLLDTSRFDNIVFQYEETSKMLKS